jgi:hypothetical protein
MKYYTFILSSITYALKGKKILENCNITSSLVKSANLKELRGCGFGLKINHSQKDTAEAILLEHGIKIIGYVEGKE